MKLLNKEQQDQEIKQIKSYRQRIIELENENKHMKNALEWLQRETDKAELIDNGAGISLKLDRPEKTKYVIATALNFNN